jgi:hypothetical protein
MILDTGTLIGISIALTSSVIAMVSFYLVNVQLQKEIRRLLIELRTSRLIK